LNKISKICKGITESEKDFQKFFSKMDDAEERMKTLTPLLMKKSIEIKNEFKIQFGQQKQDIQKIISIMNFFAFKSEDPVQFFEIYISFLMSLNISICRKLKLSDKEFQKAIWLSQNQNPNHKNLMSIVHDLIDQREDEKKKETRKIKHNSK